MHYLISLGLSTNSLLPAMSLRILLFFPKHMKIFTECHVCSRNAAVTSSPPKCRQTLTILLLSCPQASQGFFHIVPKGTSPRKVAEPLASVQRLRGWHCPETNSLRSGHDKIFCSTAFLANVVEEAEAKKVRVDDSTPGDSTHRYKGGIWEKTAVCHHTFQSHSERLGNEVPTHASLTYHWGELWLPH